MNFLFYRFLPYIYNDLRQPMLDAVGRSRYISVMADSSTDTSTRDLELVYVRYVVDGRPINQFVAVPEMKHATAEGHKEAIEEGN